MEGIKKIILQRCQEMGSGVIMTADYEQVPSRGVRASERATEMQRRSPSNDSCCCYLFLDFGVRLSMAKQ